MSKMKKKDEKNGTVKVQFNLILLNDTKCEIKHCLLVFVNLNYTCNLKDLITKKNYLFDNVWYFK